MAINEKQNNDLGYTLVELIVVIAIMAVITGVVSLSVSMIFSQDANKSAKIIDDELAEARMLSMSKSGILVLVIHTKTDPSQNTLEITRDGSSYKTVSIDRNVFINMKLGGTTISSPGDDISIEFDKSTGSVKKVNGTSAAADGLYEIESVAQKNSRTTSVLLVANTGRHYLEK